MAKKTVDSLIFTNQDIGYLRNRRIEEYDIVEGGWSIAKEEGLLPKAMIRRLSTLSKRERHIQIGLYSRDNRDFTRELHEGFRKYLAEFREANRVADDNVMSVKKDSITMHDSRISRTEFGEVRFTRRYQATSFAFLGGVEFYYDSRRNGHLYKGAPDVFGKDDMVEEVWSVLGMAETKRKRELFPYLSELREAYVTRQLVAGYYREVGPSAAFRVKSDMESFVAYVTDVEDDGIDAIDISYNHDKILVPLIGMFV